MRKWKGTFCVTKFKMLDRIWGDSQNQEGSSIMAIERKTAGKIKTQITRFSNRLSSGLNKPKRKFLYQI